MALPSFTVTGNLFEILGDISGSELVETPPTTLRFTFTPNLSDLSTPVTYGGNLYKVGIVYAGIEDDGTIVHGNLVNGVMVTDGDPVMLVAEDAGLNVTGLMWKVSLETPIAGNTAWRRLVSWWIDAYADGATVDLSAVPPGIEADANPTFVTLDAAFVSSIGSALATADDAADARSILGAGTVGDDVFTASTPAAARTAIGAGSDPDYRAAARRSRPSQPRRVLAPGNLSWLDSFINVYYDGYKFFTDFDITDYRPSGTKWYSDRANGSNSNSGLGTTLTAALVKGTAVTSLTVAALPADFPSGSKIVVADQDAHGTWHSMVATLSSIASSGATSISVNSVTPDFDYSAGCLVANPYGDVYRCYRAASDGDELIPLDRADNAYGGCLDRLGGWGFGEMYLGTTGTLSAALSTGSPITSLSTTNLSVAVSGSTCITLESGTESQQVELVGTASVGATSITTVSFTPNYAYPIGTTVRYGTRFAKSLSIVPLFPGEMTLVIGNWHGSGAPSTWALKATYSNVYTCSQVSTTKVVDLDVGGQLCQYVQVADADACELLPGSFYVNGSEVGVYPIGGGAPDPTKVWPLMSTAEQTTFRNENGDQTVYLEGFSIIGGGTWGGVHVENINGDNLDFYAKDMVFACNPGADSLNINGARRAFFQNCASAFSVKDGFNYSPSNRSTVQQHNPSYFIEVDCTSWACGDNDANPGTEDTFNASTAHQYTNGLRIGGVYRESAGAVIADVQTGCETWTVECEVYDNVAEQDTYKAGIDAQQSGVTMHVYNCRSYGNTYDLVCRGGTTVNVYNSEYDTSAIFGTLNSVESV